MAKFEWDSARNDLNVTKHGVGFATAARIFEGVVLTSVDGRFDYGEVRMRSIGAVSGIVFLAVIHTDRNGVKRIITARRANRAERSNYEAAAKK